MASFGFLRGNRDFTIIWTGKTVSALGSSMSTLVFPLVGYALTRSTTEAGLATTAVFLGTMLLSLPAGALADRWPRGRTLALANLFSMLCYASLAVALLTDGLTLIHLVLAGFLSGASEAFIGPASSAAVKTVVPPEDRPAAYAQLQIRTHASSLVGPPLGGALYSLARSLPFVLDTVSYAANAFLITRLRTPLPAGGGERKHLIAEMKEGFGFAWHHKVNRAILLWGGMINFAMTFVFVAITLRLVRIGTAPAAIGLIDTIASLAGLIGAFAAPAIVARLRTGRMTLITGSILVVAVLPLAWTTNVALTGALLAVGTFLTPANNSGISAYLSSTTPDRLQGRINAAGAFIAEGMLPAGPVLAGVVLSAFGGVVVMLVGTACVVVSLLPLVLTSAIRKLGRPSEWSIEQPAEAT